MMASKRASSSLSLAENIESPCVLSPYHQHMVESNADIFSDAAISEIYRYASGSPRLINKACTHYLVYGQQQHKNIIDDHITHSTPEINQS